MSQVKSQLLEGNLWKQIILFALPIVAAAMLQQIFNAADMAVVGRFASSRALAAVGTASPATSLCIVMITGLSVGANVRIAHAIGSGQNTRVKRSVDTAVLLSAVLGVIMVAVSELFARPLLEVLGTPADIIDDATVYVRIYFASTFFLMIYNFVAAILRAGGDSKSPLYCLIFTGAVNLGLNLYFVIVLEMGVAGVAWATFISNVLNAALLLWALMKRGVMVRLDLRDFSTDWEIGKSILAIGVPAAAQGAMFNLANLIVQAGLNSLGSDVVAASIVAINAEIFCYYMVNGFGQAVVTFVGQNYGARNLPRCREVVRVALIVSGSCMIVMSGSLWLFAEPFTKLFTLEPAVIAISVTRIKMVMFFEIASVFIEIMSGALRGFGSSTLPAVLSAISVCGTRIVWMFTVFRLYPVVETINWVYPVSWSLNGLCLLVAYLFVRGRVTQKLAV